MIETNTNNLDPEEIMQKIKQELLERKRTGKSYMFKSYYSIDDFIQYHNEAFITKAFRCLLKHEPDEPEMQLFLERLHTGEYSKLDALADIRFSDEGQSKNVKVLGLKKRSYLNELLSYTIVSDTLGKKPFAHKSYYEVNDFIQYDDVEFVRNLYKGVLEREPDAEGIQRYRNQLHTGEYSKTEILKTIRFSDEGKAKDVKILGITDDTAFSKFTITKPFVHKDHYTIADFLQYYNTEFILNLHRGLLERDPSKLEAKQYLNRLRSGENSRIEILTSIRFSKEGRSKNIRVLGINKYFLINTVNNIPIVGYFSKTLITLLTLPKLLKRLNRYENYGSLLHTTQRNSTDIDALLDISQLILKHEAELDALQLHLGSKADKAELNILQPIPENKTAKGYKE